MAKSIFVLAGVLLAFSLSATQADHENLFCDYGLYTCPSVYDPSYITCISYTRVCDGVIDCCDGVDESFCGNCTAGYIQCPGTDTCINNTRACDGSMDCLDGADETVNACGCQEEGYVPACRDSNGTAYCINETLLCDGYGDCVNGEDELFPYCPEDCPDEQLSCFGNGSYCFEVYQLCNGVFECPNAYDEGNCTTPEPDSFFCPYGLYFCPDEYGGRSCLNYTRVCDGINDCYNGTDEALCGDCPPGYILCPNTSTCIENNRACDSVPDCPDGCDEGVGACGCFDENQVPVCRYTNGDPYCINENLVCDGNKDCMYGEDEQFPYCSGMMCGPEEVTCYETNSCVKITDVCSGYTMCPSLYRQFCDNIPQFCPYGTYNCARQDSCLLDTCCLNYTNVCDGTYDCLSGSDECDDICGNCSVGMVQCPGTDICVSNTVVCDGSWNCPNGTDESVRTCGCQDESEVPVCTDSYGEPYCLSSSRICDGVQDCLYGEDESEIFGCTATTPPPPEFCPYKTFDCRSGSCDDSCCLNYTDVCDGEVECLSGRDEDYDVCGNCPMNKLQCRNSSMCVSNMQICDGYVDCPDGFDESVRACGCSDPYELPVCMNSNGDLYCLNFSRVCDGVPDCIYGEDESEIYGCTTPSPPPSPYFCPIGYFPCFTSETFDEQTCIPHSYLCDNVTHCSDGVDESFCAGCPPGQALCPDGSGVCIEPSGVCDTVQNCPSGIDESTFICGTSTGGPPPGYFCPVNEIPCQGEFGLPTCVPNSYFCNGVDECLNGTDEAVCFGCPPNQLLCPGTLMCINNTDLCDTVYDCPSGFDELFCGPSVPTPTIDPTASPYICPINYFPCINEYSIPTCVPNYYLCDGVSQCYNGTDELFCQDCPPGQVVCPDSSLACINNTDVCDTVYDCPGGFDEFICGAGATPTPQPGCPPGGYPCGYDPYRCWTLEQACDGFNDCGDELAFDEIGGFVEMFGASCEANNSVRGEELVIGLNAPPFGGLLAFSEGTNSPFCILRGGFSSLDQFNVTFSYYPGYSAVPGEDFVDLSGPENKLIFGPEDTIACINISIIDDDIVEDIEMFNFTLNIEANVPYTFIGPQRVDVQIFDNDGAVVRVLNNSISVSEAGPTDMEVCVVLEDIKGGLDKEVVFEVIAGGGSAINGVDFMLLNTRLIFSQDSVPGAKECVTFGTVIDDDEIEFNESYYFYVQPTGVADTFANGTSSSIYVTIINDDFFEFAFVNNTMVEVVEGNTISICVVPQSNVSLVLDGRFYLSLQFELSGNATSSEYYAYDRYHSFSMLSDFDDICVIIETRVDFVTEPDVEFTVRVVFNNGFGALVGPQEVAVTILDDDEAPEFEFSNPPQEVVTEGGQLMVCLNPITNLTERLGYGSGYVFHLEFNVTGRTATNDDFAFTSAAHYLSATSYFDNICVVVDILDDDYIEGTEELVVTVHFADPAVLVGHQEVVVVIMDNDVGEFVTAGFMDRTEREGEWDLSTESIRYCVSPTSMTSRFLRTNVYFVFTIEDGTAVEGQDFEILRQDQLYNYTSMGDSVCAEVRILNDNFVEGTEYFSVSVDTTSGGGSLIRLVGNNMSYVTIMDNDTIQVSLEIRDEGGYVMEDSGYFSVCVMLVDDMDGLDKDVNVTFFILDGSQAKRRKRIVAPPTQGDVSPTGSQTLTILAGTPVDESVCLTVNVNDDNIIESNETVTIHLDSSDEYSVVDHMYEIVVIVDNDGASLFLSTNEIFLQESVGEVSLMVFVGSMSPRDRDVIVAVSIQLDTADSSDIGEYTQQLTFGPAINELEVTIPITVDNIVGDDEVFTINFTPVNALDRFINGSQVMVTIDESAELSLTSRSFTGMEGGVAMICVQHANHTLERDVSVELTFVGGTADSKDDFEVSGGTDSSVVTLVFRAGEDVTRRCVDVSLLDDNIAEVTEMFYVTMRAVDSSDTVGINMSTVSILDNDGVIFEPKDADAMETDEDQTVSLCVTMRPPAGGLDRNAIISYMSQELIFTRTPIVIAQTGCFNVSVAGDNLVENTEILRLMFTTEYELDALNSVLTATVTVFDDDGATVSFAQPNQTVSEDVGSVMVCVELTDMEGGLLRPVPFTITSDRGMDFAFEFTPDSTVDVCLTVNITDDTIVEYTAERTFTLKVGNGNDALGLVIAHTIIVTDNDGAVIEVGPIADVTETDNDQTVSLSFFVSRDSGLVERNVVLTVSLIGDTTDVVLTTQTVTLEPGQSSYELGILTVIGDNIVEADEEFRVMITADNTLDSVVGSPLNFTVFDDDGAVVSFSTPGQTVTEGVGIVTVCAELTDIEDGLDRPVPFTFTSDRKGMIPFEFSATASVGNTRCLHYNIANDSLVEETIETIYTLGVVNSNDMVENDTYTITVEDDDGAVVSFEEPRQTVSEDGGRAMVCVVLTDVEGGLNRPVSFTITEDQTSSSHYFSMDAEGGDRICVNITIDDDTIIGDSIERTLTLSVVNGNDGVGEFSVHVITVTDDDGATIMFAMREQTVSENVGSVEVCALLVNVQGGLGRAAPFIITSDRGMDFSFQFEAGAPMDSTECLTVNITDNLLVGNDLERPFTLAVVDSNDILGMITTHMITVTDNDGATIMFATAGQTVSEDAGSVMVCVELVNVQDSLERAVPFTITSDRGMTFNFEFEETDSVGDTECMTVSITDDTLVEDTLMRPFVLAAVNEVDILGGVTTHTITVIDNDGVEVTLETSEVTLLEGDETLNSGYVCVSITSNTSLLQRAVQVDATVVSRTDNVPESSFTYDSMVIITPENAGGRVCFTVTILDNTDYTDVVGRVVMSFSLTNANDVFVSDITVTIIIEDDDSPLIEEVNYIPFVILEEPDGARLRKAAPSDDGCSAQIFMNSGLPYGSIVATSLRVCTNGIISIGTGHFEFFGPELFPSEYNLISSSNVLAPYWNDHDARDSSSRIIYKVYTDNLGEAATNKINSVSALVSAKHNVSFSGVWMLVAEWNRVPAYPAITNTDVNTYQAIVITDGVTTYAVYTYVCGQLEWTSSLGSDVHSVIGFNIDNDDASGFNLPFFNHPLSTYPEISSVACTNRELRIDYSNLVYLVGNNEGADQLARADCIKRANLDRSLIRESNPLFDYEAPCPCSASQARRDSRYRFASFLLAFTTGDSSFFSRDCYLQRFQPFFRNSGVQLCCYSRRFFDRGALLDSSFGIEGSSFLRYHPAFNPNQYLEFDYRFKQSCCVDAGICEEYTTLRPSDQCFFYRPQRRAWCWGDPHITTLDGGVFTFNGRGEYILTEFDTSSTGFVLQGRTSPVNATAANITTAIDSAPTQLVAFAFAMNRALPVQIEVKNEADLVVLVNSTDITGNITNVNDTYSTNSLSIVRDGEKSLTTSFPNGVGVTVTASFGMLSFVLIIPEEFRNITRGMMGNYNGDPMDDVRYQNGTMLPHNVSDRTIHEVGQSWEIEPEDSLFTYPEGLSAANFSFPDHMPLFLDEILDLIPQDIKDACGDSEECIYDYYLTQNKEIGMETLNTNMVNTDDQNQASNNPPRIMGPNVLRVDLGMTATLVFNVSDDKNMFNVSILGGLPVNSTLTPTVMDGFTIYTFTWELYEIVSNTLEFEARDELQATAVLNVQVQICACRNNGTCTIDGIIGTSAPNIVLNCECSEAWTGRYCEMDVDGCTEFMCFQGVVCNDVPAPGVGAMCGPCPEGYMGDGQKCEDVNECNGTHGCSDICYNFEGGFECRCNSGYELLNTTHCRDIDECAMLNGRCHQICNNEDGSFSCSCYPGYNLTSDGLTCQVLPESECPMNNACEQECVLLNAVEQCSCFPGYELNADNVTCADVDECLQTPCGQVCTNTEASFECSCNDGYRIQSDSITCLDINECVEAAINGNSLCPESMMCVNLQGSEGKFECVCPPGTDTAGDMCVVPTTPPPTTPTEPPTTPVPPPTGTVPPQFVDDAVIVTILDLTVESFTADLRLRFRQAFANAINDYCSENQCSPSRKRQAPRTVTADDVIMNNVRNNANGDLTFDVYVLTNGNVAFPASLVESAIEENEADFRPLGFTVMVEPLAGTMPPVPVDTLTTEQIIGIAVGCVLAALLLLVVIVVIIVCCVRRQTRRKSYDFSYGLNYDNPVADAGDDIQQVNITVKTNDEEEETPKQKAEPNIYVASGDLDDLTEENPAAIEDAAAEEKGSDRSMQSLILKFGENDDDQHSVEKEEFTSL